MSAAKRGPNWTNEEDESLCEAWLNCSQDSIVGIQQKSDTLYERVFETFVEICNQKGLGNNPGLRAPSGIKARWHVISKACSKFAGNLAQVINRQRSGATPQDNINEALILYKKDTNHSFTHMTSFRILQNAPKWIIYESNLKDKTSSGTKRKLVEDTDTVENDDCVPSTSSQMSRPLGVKSSKTILENRSNLSKSSMELAAAAKQVARAAAAKSKLTKEKIAAINRLADTTIMTTDTSNLSDTARTYIEIQQKLILEKLQSDASGGHFDAGDGEDNDEDEVVSDKGVEFLDSEED
uniref:Glutathione S-transferase T3 n=2 Tax=Culex pipiens TaxID=7175 RepID=A0A8D8IQD4_CULPI